LIGDHPELEDPEEPLALALESKIPGVVAAASEVIAKHPDRIRGRDDAKARRGASAKKRASGGGAARVGKALRDLLEAADANSDLEALMLVVDATAALAVDGSREPLGRLCLSPNGILREHVERALSSLLGGDQKATCPAPEAGMPLPEELGRAATAPVKLVFESDVGELGLELDPSFAPIAVTRVVELAKSGFYDGMVVHRVVPGFVTQLGSPSGDGFGGAPARPPLACETAPVPFVAGSVGMALAGRDTGSSQFFVTHADYPHLDGQYAWIGRSAGPWASLVEGDRVLRVRATP
jgi:cyclophilin family peptidyl-prolyl cis-trans isomerase